ncbi:MAG TPA: M15 family metallopeptidase [Candidatus Methylacidiphilales bacterium]|jgi:D-alanyl-D-alanine dipeptidase|nr:M15 family metallopeptidase [Candidatus Methylacidiphilales bacterium]
MDSQPKSALAEQLTRLAHLEISPLEEIRYATQYNFTGTKLYPFPIAFLQKDAAAALEKVQRYLAAKELGLKVWDGFRPMVIQQKMWDLIQDERYVSNPAKNSGRHTRGTAVDVTLIDKRGGQLALPTDYDNFTEKAHSDWAGASGVEKDNRELLQEAMTKFGFEIYPYEWWHFDLRNWQQYPPLDIDFSLIKGTWWLLTRYSTRNVRTGRSPSLQGARVI